jgi:hypothetical protein
MGWVRVPENGHKKEPIERIYYPQPGQVVEGTFDGSEEKQDWEYPATVHRVRKTNGRLAEIKGSAQLDRKMKKIKKGERVRITHLGGGEKLADNSYTPKQWNVETWDPKSED